jgi:hypothetical protein
MLGVYYNVSNVLIDKDLMQYKVFSLIYYLYNWGFSTYLRFVENSKNVYKDEWTKNEKGESVVSYKNIRIEYLDHIFDYLVIKEKWDEIDNLLETIMGWKMTKTELEMTQDYISRIKYNPGEELKKVLFKYLSPEKIKEIKYPRRNDW